MDGGVAVEAVEGYLKEGKMFDIILMDLYMVNMDGYEASIQIRKLEAQYKIPKNQRHFICAHSSEITRCKFPFFNYNIFRKRGEVLQGRHGRHRGQTHALEIAEAHAERARPSQDEDSEQPARRESEHDQPSQREQQKRV